MSHIPGVSRPGNKDKVIHNNNDAFLFSIDSNLRKLTVYELQTTCKRFVNASSLLALKDKKTQSVLLNLVGKNQYLVLQLTPLMYIVGMKVTAGWRP